MDKPIFFTGAVDWYCLGRSAPRELCSSRDIFQARLDSFFREATVLGCLNDDEAALLTAVVGEIGHNCFDHNLGQWPDEMGCFFQWGAFGDKNGMKVVIADRGQGILNSLKRVRPDLQTEDDALKVAFEKRISGRSPERRGNGLKFVRSVINGSDRRGLIFFSAASHLAFGRYPDMQEEIDLDKMRKKAGTGTLALVAWENP